MFGTLSYVNNKFRKKKQLELKFRKFLVLLGNISKITDPTCHEIAMSCIHDVAEILITAEQKLPSDVEPPIPIMKDLLPWLVESCVFEE